MRRRAPRDASPGASSRIVARRASRPAPKTVTHATTRSTTPTPLIQNGLLIPAVPISKIVRRKETESTPTLRAGGPSSQPTAHRGSRPHHLSHLVHLRPTRTGHFGHKSGPEVYKVAPGLAGGGLHHFGG